MACNLQYRCPMNDIQCLVIADDLTGANDTGVQFLSENESVVVIVDSASANTVNTRSDSPTVVVNTNTRFLSAEEAFTEVQNSVRKYSVLKPAEIFKKIDSTLRGNIGAEIDAVMKVSGYRIACVAPAAPRNGRTIINGQCYINGILLEKTEVAQDPFTPVTARYQQIETLY